MIPLDVFNHNVDTTPHMYQEVRPGDNYKNMLTLFSRFRVMHPQVATKFELMLNLGETVEEITDVLKNLYKYLRNTFFGIILTPSKQHLTVKRYVPSVGCD